MVIILCLFAAFFIGVPICFALGIVSIGSLIASGMPLAMRLPMETMPNAKQMGTPMKNAANRQRMITIYLSPFLPRSSLASSMSCSSI